MSDYETVRDYILTYVPGRRLKERPLAALNRIEPDVAGLKVELEDALSALDSLQQENERLQEKLAEKTEMHDSAMAKVVANANELDRLRRIEEAAKGVLAYGWWDTNVKPYTKLLALEHAVYPETRTALNQEVEG